MDADTLSLGDILQILSIVGGITIAIAAVSRHFGRVETRVDSVTDAINMSREQNSIEHRVIGERLEEHGKRIGSLEDHVRRKL